jgi:UDP-glucose pyrophosphorylase
MSKKPVLVVLAAGMGSRYGGLKQMDPLGPNGELILDYSVRDAVNAGFETVVFVIKKAIEADFIAIVSPRMAGKIEVRYAFQELTDLPEGIALPDGREKPWGTTHAVLAAEAAVDGAPFAIINADDYYGPSAFSEIYRFLTVPAAEDGKAHFAMVGYRMENTVTDHGTVARGVCQVDGQGHLSKIRECLKLAKVDGGAENREAEPEFFPGATPVSMNFWGLNSDFMTYARNRFAADLGEMMDTNPMKCEVLLPVTVDKMIQAADCDVTVLESRDVWYGVTYQEDKPQVKAALAALHDSGVYGDLTK